MAWTSCQPYLPAATFALLAIFAYMKAHPEGPDPAENRGWLAVSYLLVAAAGLCKGAAIGVVGVFLILDVYPLKRLGGPAGWLGRGPRRIWLEKLPIVAIGLALAAVGARSKGLASPEVAARGRAVEAAARMGYAALFYPAKTLWPADLCVHYGVPDRPGGSILGYAAGCVVASGLSLALAVRKGRSAGPWAAWFGYLALLAPTLGLSGYGHVIAADRYCYLASAAAAPLLAAGFARLGTTGRGGAVAASLGLAAMLGLIAASRSQCRTWLDGESLWAHALAIDGDRTPQPRDGLAEATLDAGKVPEAVALYEGALRLRPDDPFARTGLGLALLRRDDLDASVAQLSIAARLRPGDFLSRASLGAALLRLGRAEESLPHLSAASDLRPVDVDVLVHLGLALASLGRLDESSARFSAALRLDPDHPGAVGNLARVERKRRKGVY